MNLPINEQNAQHSCGCGDKAEAPVEKTCGCGPDCTCGCQDGKPCGCGDKAQAPAEKTCDCGPDCTCGCQDGKPCTCAEMEGDCGCGPDCTCGCQDGKPCTCGDKAEAPATPAATGAVTATYKVSGMTCGHCTKAVKEEVEAIPGVTAAEVDLESGQLTVSSDAPVDFDRIVEACLEAGDYTVE